MTTIKTDSLNSFRFNLIRKLNQIWDSLGTVTGGRLVWETWPECQFPGREDRGEAKGNPFLVPHRHSEPPLLLLVALAGTWGEQSWWWRPVRWPSTLSQEPSLSRTWTGRCISRRQPTRLCRSPRKLSEVCTRQEFIATWIFSSLSIFSRSSLQGYRRSLWRSVMGN